MVVSAAFQSEWQAQDKRELWVQGQQSEMQIIGGGETFAVSQEFWPAVIAEPKLEAFMVRPRRCSGNCSQSVR